LSKEVEKNFVSGLTWRVIIVIVLSALVFIPASTYLQLLTGGSLGGFAVMFMLLLLAEISSFVGQNLTNQETLILYYGIGAVSGASWSFVGLIIYRAYFINSPFAFSYKINGKPLAFLVPQWMAPSYGSVAYNLRTIFHPDFLPAITYYLVMFILSFVANLSLNLLISKIYVEKEKLSFPFSKVDVSLVNFISQPSSDILSLFLIAMVPSIVYSLLIFLQYAFGFTIIPIPYLDLTQFIQSSLPGFILAIPTVLSAYVGGFMVPFIDATYVFLSATIINLLGTVFLVIFPNIFPEWPKEYFSGMGMTAISYRLFARVWFGPSIGLGIGAAMFLALKSRKAILSLLKSLLRKEEGESYLGFPSNGILLATYFASTLTSVAVFHFLVPEVPLWVPIVASPVMSVLQAVMVAATQGVVGYSIGLPGFTWATLVYLSPYQGYAGFTAPPVIVGGGAGGFSQQVKACLLTNTKPSDLIKLIVLTTALSAIIGLVVIDYFWRIAPIPSMAYPSTVYGYPQTAVTDALLITRQLRVDVPRVVIPAIAVMLVLFVGEALKKVGLPWSSYGFTLGLFFGWPSALSLFLGSLIGNIVIAKFMGKEKWDAQKSYLVAGETLGEGIVAVILTILTLFSKSSWIWPW